jgi:hypothetical protein
LEDGGALFTAKRDDVDDEAAFLGPFAPSPLYPPREENDLAAKVVAVRE